MRKSYICEFRDGPRAGEFKTIPIFANHLTDGEVTYRLSHSRFEDPRYLVFVKEERPNESPEQKAVSDFDVDSSSVSP